MEPERVDLSALDPTQDRLRYERLIRAVVEAARPELARRARASNPLAWLASWARPGLAAAAIVGLLAVGALAITDRDAYAGQPTGTVADALGLPAPAADWLAEGREPTRADLVLAMEDDR